MSANKLITGAYNFEASKYGTPFDTHFELVALYSLCLEDFNNCDMAK